MNELMRKDFEKQGYRVVGSHSVVKVCEYSKKALLDRDVCYKQQFYGINCWQCVEMSPSVLCNQRCIFCWRDASVASGAWQGVIDDPKFIVDNCIKEWQHLLVGFGGREGVNKSRFSDVSQPRHFAISLTGEPTMYPLLPEMIAYLKQKGITSFLVTNGTNPAMLKNLLKNPPTQLYVSLLAPDRETYLKTCCPVKDYWDDIMESLSLLKHFPRSCIRLTLTKGWNFVNPEGFAEIIKCASPDFVECKGYSCIGHSQKRLAVCNMPFHNELEEFARVIAEATGYVVVDRKPASKVVLLAKELKNVKLF